MNDLLKGRVAIVTGSGQGVGRAIAIGLAMQGAIVVTNNRKPGSSGNAMLTKEQFDALSDERKKWYLENQAQTSGDAETTAQAIRDMGGEASAFFGDVSDFETARELVESTVEKYGRIDILCNVAGTFGICEIDQISEELWDRVIRVKLKGTFNTMRFAVPHMKKQGFGRIINCTSRAFMGDVIKHAEYCAANAGVVGLTRAAAIELREFGITCNAFGPWARTRASYELEAVNETSDGIMMGKLQPPKYENTPVPETVAPFITYLASEHSEKISGSIFTISGNKIQLHQEPVITKTLSKPDFAGMWTVEEIIETAPRYMFFDYHSIADV
ncbi:MAG: SDR family oxidoreductase [Oscillospiraceae bacterium]|nr:SDR family oxidoreductase [Oscillospiraceae bacterium]